MAEPLTWYDHDRHELSLNMLIVIIICVCIISLLDYNVFFLALSYAIIGHYEVVEGRTDIECTSLSA